MLKKCSQNFTPFTFDFDSLYDSFSSTIVLDALQDAMDICRESWSNGFKKWISELVKLSIESAIGEFDGKFFKPKKGLPTGGSMCVELANIAVYFVLKMCPLL